MLLLTVTDTALRFICATRKLYTKRSGQCLNETGVALNELYQLGFCSRLWWPGRRLFFCVTCGSCVSVSLRSSSGRCRQRVLQQPDWTAGNRAACLESMWNPLHRQHARWDLDNSDWTCASNPFCVPYPLCIKITLLRTGKMWLLLVCWGFLYSQQFVVFIISDSAEREKKKCMSPSLQPPLTPAKWQKQK